MKLMIYIEARLKGKKYTINKCSEDVMTKLVLIPKYVKDDAYTNNYRNKYSLIRMCLSIRREISKR